MSSSWTSDGGSTIEARVDAPAAPRASARAEAAAAEKRGLSIADPLTLLAIGLVVVLVSLPRLRRFAVRENETDAIHALKMLAADAEASPDALAAGGLGALLAASSSHQERFTDVELLEDGRLRRHGYLFDVVRDEAGRACLRAWPWEHGRTGVGAFVAGGGAVLGFENADGRYSGPASPPVPPRGDAAARSWLVMR